MIQIYFVYFNSYECVVSIHILMSINSLQDHFRMKTLACPGAQLLIHLRYLTDEFFNSFEKGLL